MSARFCGTGSCVPDYVMDNDGVAELVETGPELRDAILQ